MIVPVDFNQGIGCQTCWTDCPAAGITIKDGKAVHGKRIFGQPPVKI